MKRSEMAHHINSRAQPQDSIEALPLEALEKYKAQSIMAQAPLPPSNIRCCNKEQDRSNCILQN